MEFVTLKDENTTIFPAFFVTISSILFYFYLFLYTFLAIFRNEITTILTPSTSEGDGWGVVTFGLEVPDYESAMLIYSYIYK